MKLIAFVAAGLVAAAGLTPATADAQYRGDGWRGGYDRGWNDGPRYRDDRRFDNRRGWNDRRGWRGNRGWHGGRSRVVCRWDRGYYGPVKRCFRIHR
ncbi:hypothetical protein [Sphingomonas sp. RS2018]